MAIGKLSFETVKELMTLIPSRPATILTVGYPDMLVTIDQVRAIFGDAVAQEVKFRPDSDAILKWHGLVGTIDKIIETEHFFSLINAKLTVVDINEVRGGEIIQDLNGPLRPELEGRFDIVYDGGTLEHLFNIGQAMQNFLRMAKVGGFIYHNNPLNVPNHGFYNFNPTFYHDFYTDNGHRLVSEITAYFGGPIDTKIVKLPSTARYKEDLPESWITVVAQRLHERTAVWPMQTKYKINPNLRK